MKNKEKEKEKRKEKGGWSKRTIRGGKERLFIYLLLGHPFNYDFDHSYLYSS